MKYLLRDISEDLLLFILNYLSYEDLFYNKKSLLSKIINNSVKKMLKISKRENEISNNFLLLYWSKNEIENIPMILYRPKKFGISLKNRLFNIFDSKEPHQKIFISNIFTNKLSFMIKPLNNEILLVEFLENKFYNVYSRYQKIMP